jgi:hypothetical protein
MLRYHGQRNSPGVIIEVGAIKFEDLQKCLMI